MCARVSPASPLPDRAPSQQAQNGSEECPRSSYHAGRGHQAQGGQYEAGALDEDAQAADLLQEYEAKIAALERMVGRQALEIEFLKGALKNAPRPRSVNTSVIAGPAASPSQKDAG